MGVAGGGEIGNSEMRATTTNRRRDRLAAVVTQPQPRKFFSGWKTEICNLSNSSHFLGFQGPNSKV